MSTGYYELKKASDDQFHFVLKAGNHEVILSSERYKQRSGATNGIKSVRENCASDSRYERKKSTNKKDYFVLKAANHEIIGKSEMYESVAAMENGINSVKTNGLSEDVKDKT